MLLNTLILLLVSVCLYLYWFYKKAFSYFEKRNVPHLKPTIFVGNMGDTIFKKKFKYDVFEEIYRKLEPHRIVGLFNFHKPWYMVRDPELLKAMLIKDFGNFPDRGTSVNAEDEPLTNHLANMTGEKWKNYRIKMTPAFSTGKMKLMFPLIRACGENLDQFSGRLTSNDDFEMKDLCSRLTTDVIATCALGLETNTVANPRSEFRNIVDEAIKPRIQATIRSYFPNIPKKLIKYFQLYIFDRKIDQFFFPVIRDTVRYREENKISRNDFLNILIQMKNNSNINRFKDEQEAEDLRKLLNEIGKKSAQSNVDMTLELMMSQSFVFFLAGAESIAAVLSFLLFELSLHPDLQNKVREEINTTWSSGELTYEMMKNMKYADMVISETFRLHPPFPITMRRCAENYKIPDSEIVVNKGALILIPSFALHKDEKYYEKPDEFYPEHFTEEAIASRPHFSYLPFGEGPRICIAARFVRIVVKTGLIYFLKNVSYRVSPKMKFPLQYIHHMGFLNVKDGLWLRCEKI